MEIEKKYNVNKNQKNWSTNILVNDDILIELIINQIIKFKKKIFLI